MVAEPDGGLALVAVLAAGAGRLERAHVALRHELVVAHPQVVLIPSLVILPLAGAVRTGGRGGGREGEGGGAELGSGCVAAETRVEARGGEWGVERGAAAGGCPEEEGPRGHRATGAAEDEGRWVGCGAADFGSSTAGQDFLVGLVLGSESGRASLLGGLRRAARSRRRRRVGPDL